MKPFNKVLILGHYTVNDPTTVNTIKSFLALSNKVILVQQSTNTNKSLQHLPDFRLVRVYDFRHFNFLKGLVSVLKAVVYFIHLKYLMLIYQPDVVVSFMLYPLAALSPKAKRKYTLVSCVYDIPSVKYAGKLDKVINTRGWKMLKQANFVWASDKYKAELAKTFAELNKLPLVCHNCPPLENVEKDSTDDRKWLRNTLQKAGVPVSENSACILLRAGAIGPYGGIEETLEVMLRLPDNFIFLMMGRPEKKYLESIEHKIKILGLEKRAIIWNRPDDESWQKAIAGADIGHLVHLLPDDSRIREQYELNSSLSNYRLFNYMAAGLPVLSYDDSRLDSIHHQLDCFSVVERERIQESLYTHLYRLCTDKDYYTERSHASYRGFTDDYNWQNQFAPVLKQLTSID